MTNDNPKMVTSMTSQVSNKAPSTEPLNLQSMLPQLVSILVVGRIIKRAPIINLKRVFLGKAEGRLSVTSKC